MSGEKNLERLLASLKPELSQIEYVFCTFESGQYGDGLALQPEAAIMEAEGLTLIIPREAADEKHISYQSVFKKITLKVHSSLDAVGLTAAFSNKLAEHGISANVIAGYYHDHIYVQSELANRAVQALGELG